MYMSTVTFRHENKKEYKLKGVKHLIKESIIDGEKGMSFVFTKKEGDAFHRIFVKEISKDKYELKEKKDDKETVKEIDTTELKKMLKDKDLEFVKSYVEKEKGTYKGKTTGQSAGAKKSSKKASKKSSKKASKKSSKKASKKSSKKSSMKGGAKKSSKKASKKSSKKSSMKGGAKKSYKKSIKNL